MLDHTLAVDAVKLLGFDRQTRDVPLHSKPVAVHPEFSGDYFDRRREIDRDHGGTLPQQIARLIAGASTHIRHQFAGKILRRNSKLVRDTHSQVRLRTHLIVPSPLPTEAIYR